MSNFQDNKEQITCLGGSLDGRELWIAKGLQRFEILGHGGTKESYVRDGQTFVMAGEIASTPEQIESPCCQLHPKAPTP